jgi:cytoskeletal protein CcmA (bactofilin family)
METPKSGEFAHIGKSVVIKGELSGSEDLYIDGRVSGTIELRGNRLTIGPNGQIQANINAKGVVVQGKLEGSIQASDRVELRASAVMVGDVVTQRIAIEDGAYLKGKVDIQKEASKAVSKPEAKPEATSPASLAAAAPGGASSGSSGSSHTSPEQKK